MAIKSKGRGTAAAFGLLLLFAGVIGGAALFVVSERRSGQAVDEFARAPIGCTTTLDFTETGTFYVFEEVGGVVDPPDGDCAPTADPVGGFDFEFLMGETPVVTLLDDSIEYAESGRAGRSVASFTIDDLGNYEIEVRGDDPTVVAAIGRDPAEGVDDLRRGAVIVAIAGVALGLLLLVLAGRRSKLAATPGLSDRTPAASDGAGPTGWPPQPPVIGQFPVDPLVPPSPITAPDTGPPAEQRPSDPWAPPTADQAAPQELPDPTDQTEL